MTEAEALANAKAAVMWEYIQRVAAYHRRMKTAQNASKTGQRVCECGCGRRFSPYRANQKYARPECRGKAWRKRTKLGRSDR
jgi:hypothetical protein